MNKLLLLFGVMEYWSNVLGYLLETIITHIFSHTPQLQHSNLFIFNDICSVCYIELGLIGTVPRRFSV